MGGRPSPAMTRGARQKCAPDGIANPRATRPRAGQRAGAADRRAADRQRIRARRAVGRRQAAAGVRPVGVSQPGRRAAPLRHRRIPHGRSGEVAGVHGSARCATASIRRYICATSARCIARLGGWTMRWPRRNARRRWRLPIRYACTIRRSSITTAANSTRAWTVRRRRCASTLACQARISCAPRRCCSVANWRRAGRNTSGASALAARRR